jgi:hypothetical protein
MHDVVAAAIVTPIIAALAIAFWLVMVFRSDAHPLYKHREYPPPGDISGGSFTAFEGGRQLMPRPDGRPGVGVPTARSASEHGEQYTPEAAHGQPEPAPGQGEAGHGQPAAAPGQYAPAETHESAQTGQGTALR